MIKHKSLKKRLEIAAMAGILMLLLGASCIAQTPLDTNSSESCICPCMEMDSGDCIYFSAPGQATLVSPRDAIGTANPTFVWNPVVNCTKYCLKVASANQPNVPIRELCYDAHEVLSDRGCLAKPELNLVPGSYRWWINTSNCKGKGPWSNFTEFKYQLGLKPTKPTPLSPMGLISTKTPTFKWTAVPAATRYNLQVKTENKMVLNVWFDAERVTRGDLCSVLSPASLPDETYFWGIRACINDNCEPAILLDQDWQYFENICAFKPGAGKNKARIINR